jgi:hypothetical protein
MNETDLLQARLGVRRASNRLAENARALAIASAKAREVGLAARVADLRQAVVTARRAGVSPGTSPRTPAWTRPPSKNGPPTNDLRRLINEDCREALPSALELDGAAIVDRCPRRCG